ncbi:MAG TPA: sporulation phosphorelay system protein KapB [Pseudogracilibacillus sp.]|nr:sporulation phosphorelay system protein KapB [Pseudogracilibacillus sp.]
MVQVNDIVKARYNSGEYIGRVLEERGNFLLVEVLAVLEHPQQGDLHHLGEVDGVAFHERKALAYREKFNARKRTTKLYEGDVPTYAESLKTALNTLKKQLTERNDEFGELSLSRISDLEKDFYNKIFEE